MQEYQLLRDNKESGPFTASALIEKGLKPYDLIWAKGKTAAWQYPSEVNELKAFAPIVEEQPFDRFYKKPQLKVVTEVPVYNEPQAEIEMSAIELPEKPKVKPRIRIRADWRRIESRTPEIAEEQKQIIPEKNVSVPVQHINNATAPAWQAVLNTWENNNLQSTAGTNKKTTGNQNQHSQSGLFANKEQEDGGVLVSNNKVSFYKKNIATVSIAASFILLLGGGYFVSGYLQNAKDLPAKVSQDVVPKNTIPVVAQNENVQAQTTNNIPNEQNNPVVKTVVLTVPIQSKTSTTNASQAVTEKNTSKEKSVQQANFKGQPVQNKVATKQVISTPISVTNPVAATPKKVITKDIETVAPPKKSDVVISSNKSTDDNVIRNYINIQPSGENDNGVVSYNYKVSNISQTKLDLVMIDLQYFDASGKFQKGQTVYVKNLSPDQAVMVTPPDAKQAAKITCKVSMVSAPQKNLYLIAD
ncbi:MAG: hypothetical protein ABIY35_07130 [Chitinophagaceae bacterium]